LASYKKAELDPQENLSAMPPIILHNPQISNQAPHCNEKGNCSNV